MVAFDPARQYAPIVKNGSIIISECEPIFEFCLSIIDFMIDDCMPDLDRKNIRAGILKTTLANLGQVDHFDWLTFRYPQLEKPTQKWIIKDSMSVVIQLEGESDIFVNVSAHTFLKKQLSKLDVDKQFKSGYVDIQEIMGEYEVPVVEERKLVHLVPGTVLIFFGNLPHGGFAASNLVNRRIHMYLPILGSKVLDEQVVVVNSNSALQADFFKKHLSSPIPDSNYHSDPSNGSDSDVLVISSSSETNIPV